MKKRDLTLGATEFKAKCLELIDEVHDRKRNSIVITKRGKPWVKLVPVAPDDTPLFGCMKGTIRILGDITEPVDVDWDALKDE
ncbi:MAG TPA: type II toxin-antitoxin system prevent-host-death family antitoxin [Bryobacteraceae bacterium]|nr:type II toxin-antitoxin system prevent-host-death family antitoxin [Bryobacteraceae bacterium]